MWPMPKYRWMKRVPKMKNKRCSDCGREFALWLAFISMRHRTAKKVVGVWIFLWCAFGVTGLGLFIGHVCQWRCSLP